MDLSYFYSPRPSGGYDGMHNVVLDCITYTDDAGKTMVENSSVPNPNVLFTVSKGVWAVKLCSHKIPQQSLTEGMG